MASTSPASCSSTKGPARTTACACFSRAVRRTSARAEAVGYGPDATTHVRPGLAGSVGGRSSKSLANKADNASSGASGNPAATTWWTTNLVPVGLIPVRATICPGKKVKAKDGEERSRATARPWDLAWEPSRRSVASVGRPSCSVTMRPTRVTGSWVRAVNESVRWGGGWGGWRTGRPPRGRWRGPQCGRSGT